MIFKKRLFFPLVIIFIVVVILIIYKTTHRHLPTLLPGAYIQDREGDLDAGFFSVPFVFDWNGDDKKDLLVGLTTSATTGGKGKIKFFQNIGSKNIPLLDRATFIQACSNTCELDVEASF
jgi:hypothetical protein